MGRSESIILALLAAAYLYACEACIEQNSVLVATSPIKLQLKDYKYNDDTQDYEQTMSVQYNQPVPGNWRNLRMTVNTNYNRPSIPRPGPISPDQKKNQKQICLNGLGVGNPCRSSMEPGYSYKLFFRTCFDYYREGLYRVTADEQYNSGNSGSCNFDGTTRNWYLTKIDSEKDALNWTVVEDREVQKCGEPVRRYTRIETIIYKVLRGCVLHAKPQNCQPGVVTCQPCTNDQVETLQDGIKFCINKTFECDASIAGFQGCPQGFQVPKDGFKAAAEAAADHDGVLKCEPCPPNYYQGSYPDDSGSGFRAKCQPCGEYQEVPFWGSNSCSGCPAGNYPKNKNAPLQCTKCPPGTYSGSSSKKCTKCTGGFYTDQPGMSYCKKCPTEWRCLVPNKVLGRFSTTPYRWDESGNPACPTLDGKSCWKTDPETCGEKLKKMKSQLDGGSKIKALVCGPMHKKIWGFDGYNDPNHWCSITKTLFMQPGVKDVGATSCSANASMVAALPEVETDKDRCDCCDMCQAG